MPSFTSSLKRLLGAFLSPKQAEPEPLAELETLLDGASAAAITEALVSEAAGIHASLLGDAGAAMFSSEAADQDGNLFGRAVQDVSAPDLRGAMATASGLSMSGLRSSVFCSGNDVNSTQDLLQTAVGRHLPLVVHLTCRAGVGPGMALGTGHEAYHALSDSGLIQLFACNAQEVVDLSLIGRRIAELALVPVVVAQDDEQTARSLQDVRLPSADLAFEFLGAAGDFIKPPTAAQQMLFGDQRRRVPRWFDLDRPALFGAVHDAQTWGLAVAGQRAFFDTHVGKILEDAFEGYGKATGRNHGALVGYDINDAKLILVAQGSAVETARAAASYLREQRNVPVGVLGVRCLRPFPARKMAELLRRRSVLVLERADAPLSSDAPLLREMRASLHRFAGGSRDQTVLRSVIYGVGGHPLRAEDLVELCLSAGSIKSDPVYLGMDVLPSRTSLPKREVLLDRLARDYSGAKSLGLAARRESSEDRVDVRPEGSLTAEVYRLLGQDGVAIAPVAASLLQGALGGHLRCRTSPSWETFDSLCVDRVTHSVGHLDDPGDGSPVDVGVVAMSRAHRALRFDNIADWGAVVVDTDLGPGELWDWLPIRLQRAVRGRSLKLYRSAPSENETEGLRDERLIGALLGALSREEKADLKIRKLRSLRADMLDELPDAEQDARADALVSGFEGLYEVKTEGRVVADVDADAIDVSTPFAVKHLKPQSEASEGAVDSLERFWNQLGVLFRTAETDEIGADPYLTSGVLPPLSASFRDHGDTRLSLPSFDSTKCTGCARCWTACPDSAIGAVSIGTKSLLEAGMNIGKEIGAQTEPLRMMLSKLGPKANKYLKTADPVPATAAKVFESACREMLDKAPLAEDRKQAISAAFDATLDALGTLPVARTEPFFYDRENDAVGSGELLALAINPDACKGCGACIAACEPEALVEKPSEARRVGRARRVWDLWQKLPDTSGETIDRMSKHAEVGPLPALLLSRHCSMSMVGGDGVEPGSGARTALRLVLASCEAEFQKQLLQHASDVDDRLSKVSAKIQEILAEALPTKDLDALAAALDSVKQSAAPTIAELASKAGEKKSIDSVRLQRLVQVAQWLEELRDNLRVGPYGMGRARVGLVLAPDAHTRGIGAFPYNPFQVPTVIDGSGEAASFARGVLEGQLREAAEDFALLRLADLEASKPTEAVHALEQLMRLTWEDFTEEERRLSPPLLLVGQSGAFSDQSLAQMLDGHLPVKIVLLGDGADGMTAESNGAARTDLGVLALGFAHRSSFVAQTSIAEPGHLSSSLKRALAYDGPALIHIHAPSPEQHGFARDGALRQAKLAVATRAFPLFVFDPNAEGVFGTRLEIDGNPDPGEIWSKAEDGTPLTPISWTVTEARFASHFTEVGDSSSGSVDIADYLALDPSERQGSTPVIRAGGDAAEAYEISAQLADLAERRLNDWRVLQELAGLVTPFTERVRKEIEAEVAEAHAAELASLKAEYEGRIASLRDEYRAEVAKQIKERLVALAGGQLVNAQSQNKPS